MTEESCKQALVRVDQAVSCLTLPRDQHLQLVQDLRVLQECVYNAYHQDESPPKKSKK